MKAKYYIYRNLTKGVWSVRYRGKVIAHADELRAWNVEFRVSKTGRERVLREQRKSVHAYAVTDIVTATPEVIDHSMDKVRYDPYDKPYFFCEKDGLPILHARRVIFTKDGEVFVDVPNYNMGWIRRLNLRRVGDHS